MTFLDRPTTSIDLTKGKEKIINHLDIVNLGGIDLSNSVRENVKLVKFVDLDNQGFWLGLFIPEGEEEDFGKWLDGSGFGNKIVQNDLDIIKQDRISQLLKTNLAPVFVFDKGLNSEEDFGLLVEEYSHVGGPAMLGIGSDLSERGKSTLAAIVSRMWHSDLVTGDLFAGDNGGALYKILESGGWSGMDVKEAFNLIEQNRHWEKLRGKSYQGFIDDLWNKWANTSNFMVIDWPAMKKDSEGRNTRPTDWLDAMKWALPCFLIPDLSRVTDNGYDDKYMQSLIDGYCRAIKSTWNLDQDRVKGLRKIFEIDEKI